MTSRVDRRHVLGPRRIDRRHHRSVGCRQDDVRAPDDRRASPDRGRGPGHGRGPASASAGDPRADRLHAAVVRPLPGPDDPRERRLRRVALRAAVVAPTPSHTRGPRDRRPVGGPRTGARAGSPAACSAAWSSPRPSSTTRRSCSSTSRLRVSTRCCARTIWEELARLRDEGRTLLVTTQYVSEAERVRRRAGHLGRAGSSRPARLTSCGILRLAVTSSRSRRRRPIDAAALRTCRRHPPDRAARADRDPRRPSTDAAKTLPDVVDAITAARRRRLLGGRGAAVVRRGLRDPRRARHGPKDREPIPRESRPPDAAPSCASSARLLAFVGKELVETLRRPGAIVSLILGPFLIMAVFGAGFNGIRRPLETIVVVPASSELPGESRTTRTLAGPALHVADVVQDRPRPRRDCMPVRSTWSLSRPDDPAGSVPAGKQIDDRDPGR